MDSAHVLPAVFLGTVGTMYTILVALVIPSARRLDKNGRGLKKVIRHFTALSTFVFFDIAYNGYILYTLSGGKPISQLHILTKLFPSVGYLRWSWAFSILSVAYILLFSCWLFYLVLLMLRSIKVEEIEAQKEENNKDIRALQEKKERLSTELEEKNTLLEQLKTDFLADFGESRTEIREKAKLIIRKGKRLGSWTISSEIKHMLDSKNRLSGPEESPFEEYITRAKKVEAIEDLPDNLLQIIGEYRACLGDIDIRYKEFLEKYNKIDRKKDTIYKNWQEMEKKLERLEEENKDLDEQLNELETTIPISLINEKISYIISRTSSSGT